MLHLAIFGSRARGGARPDSDLDVLIDEIPGRRFSLYDLIGVQHIISDELGIDAQATMREGLNERFKVRIADDVTEVF